MYKGRLSTRGDYLQGGTIYKYVLYTRGTIYEGDYLQGGNIRMGGVTTMGDYLGGIYTGSYARNARKATIHGGLGRNCPWEFVA